MHELGIVTHTAQTVSKFAKDNGLTEILSVTLEVGEVSGIVLTYFTDLWDYIKDKYPAIKNSELKLENTEAVTYCDDCKNTYRTIEYAKICPHCGSARTWLLTGNECVIKEVVVPDD